MSKRSSEASPPKALLLTRNFPPLVGGMEKLNRYLLVSLLPRWQPVLCGPTGCRNFASMAVAVSEVPLRPLPAFILVAILKSLWMAWNFRPTLVIAGSGLTAPMAWLAARFVGAKLVIYLHGLDIVVPNRIYQTLWLPFIRRGDLILVNSNNTAQLAKSRKISIAKIQILSPGTEIPVLNSFIARDFRVKQSLVNAKILLSVGRFTARKGLSEFVAKSLPAIVTCYPETCLMIIGEEAKDALYKQEGSERQRIISAARSSGVESHIKFVGQCDDSTLSAAYQAADCHVFPIRELPGDIEGFGMVALESAAHNVPTVAFAVGGVPDAVSVGKSGLLVEPGDYEGFARCVLNVLRSPETGTQSCREFAEGMSWTKFGVRLREMLGQA